MNQLGSLAQFASFTQNLSLENIKNELSSFQSKLASIRPPQEFFNVKNFSNPKTFSEVQARVSYNLRYYSTNYTIIIGLLSIYTLVTNLLLLFVIIFSVAGVTGISKLEGQDLNTPFGPLKTTQLYTALLCVSVPLGFLASPISTLMWLIGASIVTVFGHAALLEKPIETVFEEETV
ncbi:hypothetical protein TPHA_0D01610 [Tetrapisispora phaffii CBS 4417]|uniref:PRA1 family protein n=1 Tax=Tetrapisispora phaffii (strain ATCC 24235 / CBS 4417 / NBRC 1672 / NRRL Y-8282 / UCD 70-5) TaxID=1071381 RepID=G8BSI0_TETPH|nr:hypothetical protein TPHA_0D01610 [Tetrapisispora phaffii CBS 4417]CCE62801.1 hypothetical protein TPHA_0D01610 [Tetrapisispora phaffii CBS 4417]